jgi:hypothetical protein
LLLPVGDGEGAGGAVVLLLPQAASPATRNANTAARTIDIDFMSGSW